MTAAANAWFFFAGDEAKYSPVLFSFVPVQSPLIAELWARVCFILLRLWTFPGETPETIRVQR